MPRPRGTDVAPCSVCGVVGPEVEELEVRGDHGCTPVQAGEPELRTGSSCTHGPGSGKTQLLNPKPVFPTLSCCLLLVVNVG